jgi:uncharacterized membrane protein
MISTSWFFFLIFLAPLLVFLFWLMKQDRRKGWLGIAIVAVLVIIALIVSSRASRNAAMNFEQRKLDAESVR